MGDKANIGVKIRLPEPYVKDNVLKVAVIEYNKESYHSALSNDMISNMYQLELFESDLEDVCYRGYTHLIDERRKSITLTIYHRNDSMLEHSYNTAEMDKTLSVVCEKNDKGITKTVRCPMMDNNYTLTCDGIPSRVDITCPVVRLNRTCGFPQGGKMVKIPGCVVNESTSLEYTECVCNVCKLQGFFVNRY